MWDQSSHYISALSLKSLTLVLLSSIPRILHFFNSPNPNIMSLILARGFYSRLNNNSNRPRLHDLSLEEEVKKTVSNFISIDYKNRRIRKSNGFAWYTSRNRQRRSMAYSSLYSLLHLLGRQNPVSIHNECLERFDFYIGKLQGYFKGEWLDELEAFSRFLHEHDNDKYRGNKGTVSRLEFKLKYLIDWYNTVFKLQDQPNFSDEICEEEALKERFEVFEKTIKDIEAQIMEVKTALKLRAELASLEFDISSPTTIIRKKDTKVEPPIPLFMFSTS